MILTEQEAATKWCPFSKMAREYGEYAGGGGIGSGPKWKPTSAVAVNRPFQHEAFPALCCMGSRCMAWKWNIMLLPFPSNQINTAALEEFQNNGWTLAADKLTLLPPPPTKGFCGLVGKP